MNLATNMDNTEQEVLNKANMTLLEIIKREWGTTWTTAIQELAQASDANQNVCMNNFKIMKMLSEEVFNFSQNEMTSTRVKELKTKFSEEFTCIYTLCDRVSKTYQQNSSQLSIRLVKASLETLNAFLGWMPLSHIFMSDMISSTIIPLMKNEYLIIDCLKGMTEIFSLNFLKMKDIEPQYANQFKQKILEAFNLVMEVLGSQMSQNKNYKMEREIIEKAGQQNKLILFDSKIKAIVSMFTGLFKTHFSWMLEFVKDSPIQDAKVKLLTLMMKSILYMAMIAEIDNEPIFRQCMEFWEFFSQVYYVRTFNKKKKISNVNGSTNVLNLYGNNDELKQNVEIFQNIFNDGAKQVLLTAIVEKMPQPEEAVFSLDESGLPVTTKMNNTSHSEHYRKVKNTIRNLVKVNYGSFSNLIQQKVDNVMCFQNYKILNSVCWTIGTVTGCSPKDQSEKRFLVPCLRTLLTMTEKANNINEKSQIASLIMYIVGAYPNFLSKSDAFLFCVLNKVFEFMKNRYDGVREMAVNTFRVLCERCHEKFISINPDFRSQENGNPGFKLDVWDFLTNSQNLIEKLSLAHKIVFFEGIGHLLGNIKDDTILVHCINTTLSPLMQGWRTLINEGGNNVQYLSNDETCQKISFFLRVNERLSATVKRRFFEVFGKNYTP